MLAFIFSKKKILALYTYHVYSHPHSQQSILPVVSYWYFGAKSGDRAEVGREEM